ncbi:MAG: cysteine synthase A [Armatimonadetes bacterium]|nr:cysteine synthase A [Armatimonadota bacterium]
MKVGNILEAIGRTDIVRINNSGECEIWGKCEYLNPGGSIKDRVALCMIERAEQKGVLRPGSTIIEPTSGNTGIAMALVGVRKGYRVIIVMPEDMSEERKKIITAFGGELELTPAGESIDGAVRRADEMLAEIDGAVMLQQFENPDNPAVHCEQTGPEIWNDLDGRVDAFVAGIGSGGTFQGVGTFLREMNPDVYLVAVEPANASALLGHEPGLHCIPGIGDGFIPAILDTSLISEVITVSDEDAIETTRRLARELGLLVGTSSGANVWAARQLAAKMPPGSVIATVLPDRAERYFSTALI